MSSTTADAAVKGGMTREEKFVIFASSLGTIFEWYDFYLYAVLAPFFAALFFPAGKRHGGVAVGLRDLRRGLPHPSVRRADLRPYRRPGRPQVHLPCHDHRDGRIDLPGRRAADLHRHRLARANPAGDAAAVPGPRARRRIRRRGDIRGRTLPAWRARLCHELDSDHGHAWPSARADRHRIVPPVHGRQGVRRVGLAPSVPRVNHPAGVLGLHPAAAE